MQCTKYRDLAGVFKLETLDFSKLSLSSLKYKKIPENFSSFFAGRQNAIMQVIGWNDVRLTKNIYIYFFYIIQFLFKPDTDISNSSIYFSIRIIKVPFNRFNLYSWTWKTFLTWKSPKCFLCPFRGGSAKSDGEISSFWFTFRCVCSVGLKQKFAFSLIYLLFK